MQHRLSLCFFFVALLALSMPAAAGVHCTFNGSSELEAAAGAPHFGPEAPYQVAPSRNFDVLHTRLDLDVDLAGQSIAGSVTHRIRVLRPEVSRIELHCVDLTVTAVALPPDSAAMVADWSQYEALDNHNSGLAIVLSPPAQYGQELELRIDYHGQPTYGLFFIAEEGGNAQRRLEAWSQGEGENNRHWIPSFDYPNDKATYEGIFRVAKGQFALSNGVLLEERDLGDQTEFHWYLDTPQVNYLIMLAAAEYEIHRDSWRGIDLMYLVPPGTGAETVERCYGKTPQMLEFFVDTTGIDFPFKKYAQVVVQNFIVGGMENTTAVVMNERSLFDERTKLTRDADSLIAHELVHMWWGDMVTMREWNDIWLNEGFATYFEKLWLAHDYGDEAFRLALAETHDEVVGRDRGGPLPMVVDFFNRTSGRSNANPYVKGSSVLHMLRHQLGDENFFRVVQHYGNKCKYGFAETADLMESVKEVTGENLDWFFEQWVYMAGHPKLEVSKRWDPGAVVLTVNVRQKQEVDGLVPLFRLPVDIEVTTDNSVKLFSVVIESADEDFHFKLDGEPRMVVFDKGDWLLKELTFSKPKAELLYQLEHGDATSQLQAIQDLRVRRRDADVIDALEGVIHSHRDYRLRITAMGIFTEFPDERSLKLIGSALDSDNAHVRLKAVEMARHVRGKEEIEQRLFDMLATEPSYTIRARCVDSLVGMKSDLARDACLEALGQDSDRHEVRVAAIGGIESLGKPEDLELIKPYCGRGNSRWYRHRALDAYAGLARKLQDEEQKQIAAEFLCGMLDDSYLRTRQAVIGALRKLGDKSAVENLRLHALSEPNSWIADQAESAANTIEAQRSEQRSIEELEVQLKDLRDDVAELRRRLDEELRQ